MAVFGLCLLGSPGILQAQFIQAESASQLNGPQIENSNRLGFITHNSWARYNQFNLSGATLFEARVVSPGGGEIEVRDGSPSGPLITTCIVPNGMGWGDWQVVSANITNPYSTNNDIYLVFKDTNPSDPWVCNIDWFEFTSAPVSGDFYIEAEDYTSSNGVQNNQNTSDPLGGGKQVSHTNNNNWTSYSGINFSNQNYFKARLSSPRSDSTIEVRLGSRRGTLVGTFNIPDTGDWHDWQDVEGPLSQSINGKHDLFLVYKNGNTGNYLLNLNWIEFSNSNSNSSNINVYPAVPGSNNAPFKSKYFKFSVQEVSKLNNSNPAQATNWETAFPWFTKCQEADYNPGSWYTQRYGQPGAWNAGQPLNAYFSHQIANWSHTFCNFEMKPNTPVIIKIERLNPNGFNGGPVRSWNANQITVHPASAGATVQVLSGDVYVTMDNPAQITVDFENSGNRGLNYRDAPQSNPTQEHNKAYPYTNENNAHHAVSIFANPFIEGKPNLGDPGVYALNPGDPIPTGGNWDTLYFKPGVHKLSAKSNGNDREWRPSDVVSLESNRSYYIPGDAIVYGNFKDEAGPHYGHPIDNVRVFGHGTISGLKMQHFNDWSSALTDDSNHRIDNKYISIVNGKRRVEHKYLRVIELLDAANCTVEGLSVIDQPEHGIYVHGRKEVGKPNYMKWLKQITWRVNTDGMGPKGNTYVENCFIRTQDDGIYVGGMGIKDIVFWSDVNGTNLRLSDIAHDRDYTWPAALLSQDLLVENIDVIYARGGAFGFDGGIIATASFPNEGPWSGKNYNNGVLNTGQHLVFKNITVEDPRPVRVLFNVDLRKETDPYYANWAPADFIGLTFEDIDYQHANTTGRRNQLYSRLGDGWGQHLRGWTFDNVTIDGDLLNQSYLGSNNNFQRININSSSMIYK